MSSKKHRARLVTIDDAVHLVTLARENHAESRYHKLPFSGQRVWKLVRACIDLPRYFGVVLETDSALSGYCAMQIEPYVFADANIAQEVVLYISPMARSMVAFQTLIAEVEKHAVERDVLHINMGLSSPRRDEDIWRYAKVYEHVGYKMHAVHFWKEVGSG